MSLFDKLSTISRQRKLELFYATMKPTAEMRLLDIGGELALSGRDHLQLINSYPWKENISVINNWRPHVERIEQQHPEIDARLGDARQLPWQDKHFDIVYSNAVIEHVGGADDQRRMAEEIMRVSKRWFVTTPNRWYPFEFHLRLPFVTWLPWHGYLRAGRIIYYNHVRGRYVFGSCPTPMRLLGASELRGLFPGSTVIKQRITFMAETLITVGGDLAP